MNIYVELALKCIKMRRQSTEFVYAKNDMKSALSIPSKSFSVGDRIAGFDMLRGVAALAVATHHLLDWHKIAHIYSWGAYGVYIFFVLSGASIWVAYSAKVGSGYSIAKFLALRLVRLCPLYVSAMLLVLIYQAVANNLSWTAIGLGYLNIFFLFGFGNPGISSLLTGGWSLGIEFIFYLLFPIALALLSGKRWLWILLLAFTSQHVFINLTIENSTNPTTRWNEYTQFLGFIFYFASGCVIGRAVLEDKLKGHAAGLLGLVACLGVIGLFIGESWSAIRTGLNGITLSLFTVMAVVASATVRFGAFGRHFAEILGKSSYGVYILHPLLAKLVDKASGHWVLGSTAAILLTLALSVVVAIFLERFFETPIQRYFRRHLA